MDDFVVNSKLMTRCRFYQMFDPDGARAFGRNVHRSSLVAFVVLVQCLNGFGHAGLFVDAGRDPLRGGSSDVFLLGYCDMHNYLSLCKVCVLLCRRDAVWDAFGAARARFFTSERCRERAATLADHRRRSIAFSDAYAAFSVASVVQWVLFPFIVNYCARADHGRRMFNVVNCPFPVDTDTYNRYYIAFYAIETAFAAYLLYCLLLIDIVLLSLGWAITAQYEVLALAFKDVGLKGTAQAENGYDLATDDYEDLKSVLSDQLRLNLKVNSYFSFAKPIVLVFVIITSSLIIILTYVFILICLSLKTYSIFDAVRTGSTALYLCLQLFLYCQLFDQMVFQKESVNFGIYSCNWTTMDLKFKKLLLLATQMNNANQFVLKLSPKKIISLQFFANVMMTSYNIISVMLKTTN